MLVSHAQHSSPCFLSINIGLQVAACEGITCLAKNAEKQSEAGFLTLAQLTATGARGSI